MGDKKRVSIGRISINPSRDDPVAILCTRIYAYTPTGRDYRDYIHRATFYTDIRDGNYVIYGLDQLKSNLTMPKIFRCMPVATTSKKNVRRTFRRIVRRTAREYAQSKGIMPSQIEDYASHLGIC